MTINETDAFRNSTFSMMRLVLCCFIANECLPQRTEGEAVETGENDRNSRSTLTNTNYVSDRLKRDSG